jgi:hypothetical protein
MGTETQADLHGGFRLVNTPWRHAVRAAATLAVAVGIVLVEPHQGQQVVAQSGNPPLRGGVQQAPESVGAEETGPRLFRTPAGQLFRVSNRIDSSGGSIVVAASNDGRTWQTLTELRPEQNGVRAQEGRVAVTGTSDIALAYRWGVPRSVRHVRLARSTDAGKTWSVPTNDLDESGGAGDPQVAWGVPRTLLVAWVDARRQRRALDIYTRRSPDGGTTWEAEVLMTAPPAADADVRYHAARLLGDGTGRFWLVWIDGPVGRANLRLRRSEDDGRTWSPPQDLSGAGRQIYGHTLHRAGNRLLLTWQDQRPVSGRPAPEVTQPTPARIYATSSQDGGATWSPPVQVDGLPPAASVSAVDPASALSPSGEAWVAWHDGRHGRNDVFVARSADAGLTWGPPLRLDADAPGTAESRSPGLAVSPDGTKVAVVWDDDRSGHEAIYGRVLSGGQWSAEARLGAALPPKKAARRPRVEAVGKDSFYVVWDVLDYSQGSTPRGSGLDDTLLMPR